MIVFTKNPNLKKKKKNWGEGVVRREGARVSELRVSDFSGTSSPRGQ